MKRILDHPAIKWRHYRARRWLKRARVAASMRRVDRRPLPANQGELRVFITARNESLRLPFLLDHYVSRGADRIFVVDNASTDDTPDIVLAHPRAHLFRTGDHYRRQGYWIDYLLRRHGEGGWCIVVDADEVLVYPGSDRLDLPGLCRLLEDEGAEVLDAVLLDMYPGEALGASSYERGSDPGSIANCFDSCGYDRLIRGPMDLSDMDMVYDGPDRIIGGMRQRVFNVAPCISKFPLIKFNRGMFLSSGAHFVEGARPAGIRGALLHYKYLHDFEKNVRVEVQRGAHWNGASEYRGYLRRLEETPELAFVGPDSVRYEGTTQLLELGVLRTTEAFEQRLSRTTPRL